MGKIWREIAIDTELTTSLPKIWKHLSPPARPESIVVRRLSPAGDSVQTIAQYPSDASTEDFRTYPVKHPEALLNWLFSDELLVTEAGRIPDVIDELVPRHAQGLLLAGPLIYAGKPVGLCMWQYSRAKHRAAASHLFRCLQEPLAAALENNRHIQELKSLREKVEADNRSLLSRLDRQDISESIIGAETGLKGVCERIELVGGADVPVLILGETGSGKEVVARALHAGSRRANGPFLRVNCGAIPAELIDSHLFGHERGSFSGAESLRKGWFERADGGTLFLDEIGDLPLQAQVRLLRVLQDGSFERVGGQRSLTVDVRIITATHRDLRSMVSEGRFREDLWYRVAVFPILIPPLRERQEDIPALATHFALRAAKRLGALPLNPGQEEIRLLMSYGWPGNIRELSAVMERAVILGNGRALEIGKALGPAPRRAEVAPQQDHKASGGAETLAPLNSALAKHIERALQMTGGRVEGRSGAAMLLEINPHTLRAKMRKLGIDWKRFRKE
jgi:transcriptional regulator with GAF, ATPase, and Fis domain